MAEENPPSISVKDVPDPVSELRKMLKDQEAVIVKQNEAIKELVAWRNDYEKTVAAAPAAQVQADAPKQPEKSPQDLAFEALLKDMGIKE